ncbi:MAG TPA: hypothetical protein VK530_11225 [Candidatus Acidoferrum sp.]|nr:hypothetical protein [Candidatus Acidoferrum sp.]
MPDGPLPAFGENIESKMTGNAAFPTPKVPLTGPNSLATKRVAYQAAIAAALGGGTEATALKNALRREYINMLRQQALYVQSIANEDLPMLLSSGFEAVSTNRTRTQLPQPLIERIYSPVSTVLAVQVQSLVNGRAYDVRAKNATTDYVLIGTFTYSRPIFIYDRVPGQIYTVQARAVGGSSGYSDWSNPAVIMAI